MVYSFIELLILLVFPFRLFESNRFNRDAEVGRVETRFFGGTNALRIMSTSRFFDSALFCF
jgi:hypothetical protein